MSTIALHPRGAPAGTLRVWVGLRERRAAPGLQWTLDGVAAVPVALRPLASVRDAALLAGDPPRAFTGLFEFPGLQPGRTHAVGLTTDDHETAAIDVRSLPAALPTGIDQWFSVLLVSCYHYAEADAGVLEAVLDTVRAAHRPDLAILLGDQVYLNLPTLTNFENDAAWLAEKFEEDYVRNWFGPDGYAAVLAGAPTVGLPDDHEYWNNFPHVSPFIQNTHSDEGRKTWRKAARAMWDGFQALGAPAQPVRIDVPPVSILLADSRTERDELKQRAFTANAPQALTDWVAELNQNGWFGVFATGQSLFDAAATGAAAVVGDRTLPNYGDFGDVVRALTGVAQALFCLTGDVHWGRLIEVDDLDRDSRPTMYELITSPASLVSTVGADTWHDLRARVGGWRGRRNPWPRHAEADVPGTYLARDLLGRRLECSSRHAQKGDQVAVLALRQHGFGVQARVTFYPVHSDAAVRADVQQFELSAGIPGG